MERILNFRLVGSQAVNNEGKKIKNIYRSADVSSASAADIEHLLELGINHIIDLRSQKEIGKLLETENLEIKNIDIIGNGDQNDVDKFEIHDLAKIMIKLYQHDFINSDGFTKELEYINSLKGKPFLFHCTAGKDRTGITGVILMHLLGFEYEDIKAEYLTIDESLVNAMMTKALEHFDSVEPVHYDSIRAVSSVDEAFLEAYLLGITDQYGTVDKYLESKLNVDADFVENLKKYYLE